MQCTLVAPQSARPCLAKMRNAFGSEPAPRGTRRRHVSSRWVRGRKQGESAGICGKRSAREGPGRTNKQTKKDISKQACRQASKQTVDCAACGRNGRNCRIRICAGIGSTPGPNRQQVLISFAVSCGLVLRNAPSRGWCVHVCARLCLHLCAQVCAFVRPREQKNTQAQAQTETDTDADTSVHTQERARTRKRP